MSDQFALNKEQRNRQLIESLHGPLEEPDTTHADDEPPNFDGGAREPAPGPTHPVSDHDELLLDLLRNAPSGGGGEW